VAKTAQVELKVDECKPLAHGVNCSYKSKNLSMTNWVGRCKLKPLETRVESAWLQRVKPTYYTAKLSFQFVRCKSIPIAARVDTDWLQRLKVRTDLWFQVSVSISTCDTTAGRRPRLARWR